MDETRVIRVRYWASARAAAGVPEDLVPTDSALTVAEVRERAVSLHPDTRLGDVLAACSVLIGEKPLGTARPDEVWVDPGSSVEFLPPFAGG